MILGGIRKFLLILSVGFVFALPVKARVIDISSIFQVRIDEAAKVSLFSDGKEIVAHVYYAKQAAPDYFFDVLKGQAWNGSAETFSSRFRQLIEYDSASEPRDSYLSQLGCGAYISCTSLEDGDFSVMMRRGPARNEIMFRVVDFREFFPRIEQVFQGVGRVEMAELTPAVKAVLQEVGQGKWRLRFQDALRSIDSFEKGESVKRSPGNQAVSEMKFFQDEKNLYSLEREWSASTCKAGVLMTAQGIVSRGSSAAPQFVSALQSCNDFFLTIIDSLLSLSPENRAAFGTGVRSYLAKRPNQSDIDVRQLLFFLGELPTAPRFTEDVARSKGPAPSDSPRGGTVVVAESKKSAEQKTKAQPPSLTPPANQAEKEITPALTPRVNNAIEEWLKVRALAKPIELLAFDERSNGMKNDAGDASGTVFVATVLGAIGDGQFKVESFNRNRAPIKFTHGAYAVKARVTVDWSRIDQCIGVISKFFCSDEIKRSVDQRTVEFQLVPTNGFRDSRNVSFGQLVPKDLEQGARFKRFLKELRLSVAILDMRPL
jgi:hypothetical protein